MTPRLAWILLAGAALLGLVALLVASRRDQPQRRGIDAAVDGAADGDEDGSPPVRVQLYFPGPNGRLVRESREIAGSAEPSRLASNVVAALLEGPRSESAYRPFPEGVALGDVQVAADGTAYVDLLSPASVTPPVAGTTLEMLTLYSLVNTVVENVPGARALVVLWNGRQPRTFGGHIDTSRPLLPQPELAAS